MTQGTPEMDPSSEQLDGYAAEGGQQHAVGDRPGSPTWPSPPRTSTPVPTTPPVGLTWVVVAARLNMDLRVLEREGSIVLGGEYFPEAGYAFDPFDLTPRRVDVGNMALRPAYFLGRLTLRDFDATLPASGGEPGITGDVVQRAQAPVIGLFADRETADRAARQVLHGSIGAGVVIEDGPLGIELRVRDCDLPGRVATLIASHHGAVIAVGGQPVDTVTSAGPLATGSGLGGGDARRGGTGASGGSYGLEPRSLQTEISER